MNSTTNNVSFIRARDPSILAWNRPAPNLGLKMNLLSEFSEASSGLSDSESQHLEVYLRIKSSEDMAELYKIKNNILECHVPTGSQALRNLQDGSKMKKEFSFSKIYGPQSNQTEIFNDCVKMKVLEFINGKNTTLFTYGTSGSGKTYTILGTTDAPGIIPQSLRYMFSTLPTIDDNPKLKPLTSGQVIVLDTDAYKKEIGIRKYVLSSLHDKNQHTQTYKLMQQRLSTEPAGILSEECDVYLSVWVSFAEVYNEYIYDLLQTDLPKDKLRPKLRLGQDEKGNCYIKDLTTVSVSNGLEAYQLLQCGMKNLNYASTSLNSHSSRSHCIFTIKLVQMERSKSDVQISQFSFCDLAGSERVKLTKNVGARLKESNNINTSLHVLGRCIQTIRQTQKHNETTNRIIPYRDSKLTRLFQRALSGCETIAMIVNINTRKELFDETQHVLNFSAIAKDISIEKPVPERITVNKRFSNYVETHTSALSTISEDGPTELHMLRDQVQRLYTQLELQKDAVQENERKVRLELVNAFNKRTDELNAIWYKRLQEDKDSIEAMYEKRIRDLETEYEEQLSRPSKRQKLSDDSDVIELDDSDDENKENNSSKINKNKEDTDDEIKRLQKQLNQYQKENIALETVMKDQLTDLENIRKKYKECQTENNKINRKVLELEQLISKDEEEIIKLKKAEQSNQEENEKNLCRIFDLENKVFELSEQLAQYQSHTTRQKEKFEKLQNLNIIEVDNILNSTNE